MKPAALTASMAALQLIIVCLHESGRRKSVLKYKNSLHINMRIPGMSNIRIPSTSSTRILGMSSTDRFYLEKNDQHRYNGRANRNGYCEIV
jgi:hypothetical protein